MTGELMGSGGQVPAGNGGLAPPAAVPVSTKRVRDWLVSYVQDCTKRATTVSEKEIWDRVRAANAAYGINKKAIKPQEAAIKAASMEQDYEVHTEDLADQVDEMTALITNMLETGGPLCRLSAKPGISEKQAELTAQVQDSLLREKAFDAEKEKFADRFVKHCVSGLKVCRSRETTFISDRVIVPVAPEYTDEALMMRGFEPEDIAEGEALKSALAQDGLQFVGIADMREDGVTFTSLLCTRCSETAQDHVYIKAVDPGRIAVSNVHVETEHQQSIHEFHYMTLSQIRACYMGDIDDLEKNGEYVTDSAQMNPAGQKDSTRTSATLIEPAYKIVESWLEIPWEDAVKKGRFSEDELRAFAIEEGFPATEFTYRSQKWNVFHCGNVLMRVDTNYLKRKNEYPFEFVSFVFADGLFTGQGMMERLSSVASNKLAILNLVARVLKQNLYKSRLFSGGTGLTPGDARTLQRPGGIVITDTRVDLASDVQEFDVADTTPNAMRLVGYFDEAMRGLGVPAVLAGEGSADTATQESINNRRGQTIVNRAFARMMRAFSNAYRKHLEVMVGQFTTSRFIDIVGEDGATMDRQWVMPSEITDKLDIIPAVSFDDGNKQRLSQLFMGMMNIMAPINPNGAKEMLKLILEYNRVPQSDIEKIEGAEGSLTNVHQEIQAMLQDPDLQVNVRMDDPHPLCIQMANIALAQEQARSQMTGMPFMPPPNILEYIQTHEAMQQQMMLMQAMQQMAAGGPPEGPKGKPVQGRNDGGPGNEEGAARKDGQAAGGGNKGPMSAAGLTGQGSIGAVPGVPAGV